MIRQLGFSEARMHYMHTLFEGTTQTVAAVRLRGPLDEASFRSAVDEVVARHELLQCTIHEHDGVLGFERVGAPRTCLEFLDQTNWQVGFRAINSKRLGLEKSPWKLFVLRDPVEKAACELVLVTHHALMDGHAMDRLLRELLECYCQSSRVLSSPLPRPFRPVPSAAESLLPSTLSWPEFTDRQARLAALQPSRQPDPHLGRAPHAERRTATSFFTLPSCEVQELVRSAAEHGITFNSWVAACFLRAAFEHSPNRATMALYTAFSLRPLCDSLGSDDLGCYVAVVPTFHESCAQKPTGEVAREHGRLLTRAILEYARHPGTVPFAALRASLEPLSQLNAFVHDLGYTYAETGLLRSYGDLTVEHFFASANRALGSASAVLHAVKHRETVYFTMNYTTPLQSDRWVEKLTTSLNRLLAPHRN